MAGGFQAFFPSDAARSEAHPGLSAKKRNTEIDVVPRRATSCHGKRAPLFGASAAHRQWEDLLVAVLLLPKVFLCVKRNVSDLDLPKSGPISRVNMHHSFQSCHEDLEKKGEPSGEQPHFAMENHHV